MFNITTNKKKITMKTLTTLLLLIIVTYASFGQMEFEKGYLITKDSQRKDCLIKNEEWKNNPTEFTYKLSESASPETGNLKSVSEFGITNTCKYINANIKIDLQTKPAVGTKNDVIPVWSRERLFLKVLLEGKAKLYSYDAGKVKRFFYSLNDTAIIQLTYLEAYVNSSLIKNTSYQQQLWGNVKAPMATMNSIKAIGYNEKDLTAYFKDYNSSFGGNTTELAKAKRKPYFNLKLTPGLNSSSVVMSTVVGSQNETSVSNFDKQMGFRIGLEAELIVPLNKYHWGILFEPTFQSYSAEDPAGKHGTSSINYQSIEFPIGLRYYIPINNENTRFFINGFLIPGMAINTNSSISYFTFYSNMITEKTVDIKSSGSASFGAGVEYKRFSLEARYYSDRNLLNSASEYADYSRFSFVLGYKFLKTRFK
jgi:hypothetical protein